ncbi:MAG: hypothetical protein ACJAZV_000132 [Roseivirga sp.]|jgi:hypothetical protein
MKYFTLSLFLGFFLHLNAQEQQTDFFPVDEISRSLIETQLSGNPLSFTIRTQELQKDSANLTLSPIVENYSVMNGRIRKINFSISNQVFKTEEFDSLSRIIAYLDFSPEATTPWIYYIYDDSANTQTEIKLRNDSTIYSKTILAFNSQKKLILKQEFYGEDKIKSVREIIYNPSNHPIKDTYYENRTESINLYAYQYDSLGRLEQQKRFNNEKLASRTLYEYRQDSLVSQRMDYGFNEKPKSQFLLIEKDSMRVEVNGYFSSIDTTEYRSSFKQIFVGEDLVEYESRTVRGTFVDRYKTFYEYDNLGNWIRKTTYLNNKLIKVQNRLFRY